MSSQSDVYVISPDQKAKYEAQFVRICSSRSDFITGEQAKTLMLASGLPPTVLAHVWTLADVDSDGRMDINEFSIALHLISLKLKGIELPQTLPQSLKALADPPIFDAFSDFDAFGSTTVSALPSGSLTSQSSMSSSFTTPSVGPMATMMSSSAPPPRPAPPTATAMDSAKPIQRSGSITSSDYPNSMLLTEWAIPQPSKLKYTQQFNSHDRTRTGFLTGPQARNILIQSKLPQPVLAQIWNLADIDADGRLTCDEFVVAMHLIDCVRAGDVVPNVLPNDLIPPSYRRKRSLSGSAAFPAVVPAMAPAVDLIPEESLGKQAFVTTFEDKRKENFEKGQQELDRRRQALLEQQKREREERERKEREEQQRREQIKLEQERKRQSELEKQIQKQREIEAEKEEQRRKQLEQREAARREMERQRMIEWENTRKQDLTNQKMKTQEEVNRLKSKKKSLAIDMEQVNNKLNELNGVMAQTHKRVIDVKEDIDSMRLQRDQKLGLLSSIKAQIKSVNDRQLYLEQEKMNLALQLKNTTPTGLTNAGTDQFALQNKQININQLKSQLEHYEEERANKMADFANNNSQLSELKHKLEQMVLKTNDLANVYENRRLEAQQLRDQQIEDHKNIGWGQEVPSNVEWPTDHTTVKANATVTKFRYRCLYAFHARNTDELTIEPGDIVLVDTSACSEPGWLSGEVRGHNGWFPEAYVEKVDADNEQTIPEHSLDIQKHTALEGIDEAPENGQESVETEVVETEVVANKASFTTSEESCFQPPTSTNKSPELSSDSFKAQAMYPWKAKEDNHLSFAKGDIITIKEQQDMWWFGSVNGNSGWFPKSYVRPLDDSGSATPEDEYYVSLYPFESQELGDLAFDTNELIKVIKKEGDWWTGTIGDVRQGVFPSNYVRLAQTEEIPKPVLSEPTIPAPKTTSCPPLQSQMSAPTPPPTSEGERRDSESCDSPKPSKKSKLKKLEIVTVIAPYKATGPEQLSLERQQLVQVRKKTSSGWWEGEIQVKGKKKQVGWFPASYVKSLNPSSGSGGSSNRSTPDPVKQKASEEPELEKVIAIYSFKAQHDDELSFEPNDMIKVLAKEDTTWWKGQLVHSGAIGLFPSNHVETLANQYEEIDQINSDYEELNHQINNHFQQNNGSVEVEEEEEDFQSFTITEEERKRQNLINEFIDTEKVYVRDLEIVIDVFQVPLRRNNCITDEESEAIFVNWPQLVKCNQKFLKTLRNKKRKATVSNNITVVNEISDAFCHHLNEMSEIYIKYCSQQLSAARLIQYKTENDPNFNETAKRCSQDKRATRLPLSSYLLKPMQRITKYPLLIGKILDNTPSNHCDYHKCKEALQLSQNLCKKVNEECRARQDSERLEWVQNHVRCDGIDQNILFNSETNCLGRRQLLHSGSLIKANSGRDLVGFLFNDFLLLTIPMKEIPKMSNVFASDKAMSSLYRIYKEPILLKDVVITELSQFETNLDPSLFQIYIKSQEKYLILKAISNNERSLWIKSIDISSRHCRDVERQETSSLPKSPSSNLLKGIGRLFVTILEGFQLTTKNNVLNAYCKLSFGKSEDNASQWHTTKVVRCVPPSPTGDRSSIPRSSPSLINKNHTQNQIDLALNLFKLKWNDSTQFIIYNNSNDLLIIKCYDRDPYAPHYLIGSSKLSISDLAEEMRCISGPLNKEIRLSTSDSKLNAEPVLYLKLDLQYFE